jgi:hypothetical protein
MDTLMRYRDIVRKLMRTYARDKPSHGCMKTEAIIDLETDHCEVMHVGWDGARRVHGCVVHIDIIDEKVWMQYDGTSSPVADALLATGIPREAIVLGFHPPELRQYTDFAVAQELISCSQCEAKMWGTWGGEGEQRHTDRPG